jgi:hypothetical protein
MTFNPACIGLMGRRLVRSSERDDPEGLTKTAFHGEIALKELYRAMDELSAQGQGTRDHRRNSYTYFEDRLAGMNRRNLLIGGGSALALGGAGAFAWRRSTGSMAAYDAYSQVLRAPLGKAADVRDLIRYATLAANGHNTQPWRFAVGERTIRLFPDGRRRTPIVDPDDHHLFVSLRCAAENLVIAARATGRAGEIQIEPGDGSALAFSFGAHEAVADSLFDAIRLRQSTRSLYDGRAVPPADLAALERAAAEPGVRLILITDRARIARLRDLIVAGNDAQMADAAFMAELALDTFQSAKRDAVRRLCGQRQSRPADRPWRAGLFRFRHRQGESDKYARQIASSCAGDLCRG